VGWFPAEDLRLTAGVPLLAVVRSAEIDHRMQIRVAVVRGREHTEELVLRRSKKSDATPKCA
jgi:hypothetical protein